jgi:hypothetical protein
MPAAIAAAPTASLPSDQDPVPVPLARLHVVGERAVVIPRVLVAGGRAGHVLLGDLRGLMRELLLDRVGEVVEREADVAEDRTQGRGVAHDRDAASVVDDLLERDGDGTGTSREPVDLGDVEVARVVDDRRSLGELVEVKGGGITIEGDEDVDRLDVAEDLLGGDPQVVVVVPALDERWVLGEVEGLVASPREEPRERLAGGLDAETGRARRS